MASNQGHTLYDCNDREVEPRPATVIYTDEFKALSETCSSIFASFKDILHAAAFDSPTLVALIEEVERRSPKQNHNSIEFAVSGEMQTGKSSVINSLLGRGIVARRGDDGDSCTWVVHRYTKDLSDQEAPFIAKVTFFGYDDYCNFTKELLQRWYRAKNFAIREEDHEERDNDASAEQLSDMRDVIGMFRTMFRDKSEFKSDQAARLYLSRARSESDNDMITTLSDWVGQLIDSETNRRGYVSCKATTASELLRSLQRYTIRDPEYDIDEKPEPDCWPIVKRIDISFAAALLDGGITLVDLPGLSDVNKTRRTNAIRHHKECSHIIIVANIGRAEADESLRSNLLLQYKSRGPGHTILVLTHADDIDEETTVKCTLEQRKELDRFEIKLKGYNSEKLRLIAQKKTCIDLQMMLDVSEEINAIDAAEDNVRRDIKCLRLSIRNDKVINAVRSIYAELTGDDTHLPVYAVGNKAYYRLAHGWTSGNAPDINVGATGIPALRSKLFALPSEGRMNEMQHLVTRQIPAMLTTFELYCTRQYIERQDDIKQILKLSKSRILDIAQTQLSRDLKEEIKSCILMPFSSTEKNWAEAARLLVRRWVIVFKTSDHLQLLKRNGIKKGRKRAPTTQDTNWNAELLSLFGANIEIWFNSFYDKAETVFDHCAKRMINDNRVAHRELNENADFNLCALKTFLAGLSGYQDDIKDAIKTEYRHFKKSISNVLIRAVMHSDESYIEQPMTEIYASVSHMTRRTAGPHAPTTRLQKFEQQVTQQGGVWATMQETIKDDLEAIISQSVTSICDKIEDLNADIDRTFGLMCEQTENVDEKTQILEDKLREQLSSAIASTQEVLDGAVAGDLKTCMTYGKAQQNSTAT